MFGKTSFIQYMYQPHSCINSFPPLTTPPKSHGSLISVSYIIPWRNRSQVSMFLYCCCHHSHHLIDHAILEPWVDSSLPPTKAILFGYRMSYPHPLHSISLSHTIQPWPHLRHNMTGQVTASYKISTLLSRCSDHTHPTIYRRVDCVDRLSGGVQKILTLSRLVRSFSFCILFFIYVVIAPIGAVCNLTW